MIQVWDLALRLFHWLLVTAIVMAFCTGRAGGSYLSLHVDSGIFIFSLLVFRFFWGFLGTENALFKQFFPSIARLRAFFSSQWSGVGHSPIAGLYVIAMLCILTTQVVLGLFSSNEDIDFSAPLAMLVSASQSHIISYGHSMLSTIITFMVVLHIISVGFHLFIRKDDSLLAMITGKKKYHVDGKVRKNLEVKNRFVLLALGVSIFVGLFIKVFTYQLNYNGVVS